MPDLAASAGLLRSQSRAQHMLRHIQSDVDSELERWVVRHCAGALHSAYAEVRITSGVALQVVLCVLTHAVTDSVTGCTATPILDARQICKCAGRCRPHCNGHLVIW